MFPIVGVQTVEHVKAMPAAAKLQLTREEIQAIRDASPFNPMFPMNFLYDFQGKRGYDLDITPADNTQYRMGAWINAPPPNPVSTVSLSSFTSIR